MPSNRDRQPQARNRAHSRSALGRIRQILARRPDSEHEMTVNRLAFVVIVSGYLCVATWMGNMEAKSILLETYPVFIGYILLSFVIFAHIIWRPGVSVARRVFAIVHDLAMISFAAQAAGVASGFFYPLYLWTVFGNGFRFGVPYLHAAMVVALIGFAVALTVADYWSTHFGLSVALMAGLVLLPLYVSVLIRKLSEAKRQAEEANKAKSLFLASVSHELRTPLNAIIGLGDLLHDQVADREQRNMTRTIAQSGRALLRLINTVLDFSRSDAGQDTGHMGDFDLHGAAAQVRAMLQVQAAKKGIEVALNIGATVPRLIHADRRFVDDVLMNLTANAVKFTETGYVLITIDATETNGSRVGLRFAVTDTGIGIAPEAQARIFDQFTQADETIIDRYGGTGLGLAICKRLVEQHDGTIGLDSEPGRGSTFWFEVEVGALADERESATIDNPVVVLSADPRIQDLATLAAPTARFCTTLDAVRDRIALMRSAPGASQMPVLVIVDEALGANVSSFGKDTASVLIQSGFNGTSDTAVRMRHMSILPRDCEAEEIAGALHVAARLVGGQPEDGPQIPDRSRSGQSFSVLIAEDNVTNQMVLAKILERAGHRSTIASNGEEALTALRNDSFDIVLMDVNMPVMNGIEATKLYRFMSLGAPRRLPIIALTADATPEARERCLQAGMDECALKPIEPHALLSLIDGAVQEPVDAGPITIAEGDETVTAIAAHPAFAPPRSEPIDRTTLSNLEKLGGRDFVQELVGEFLTEADVLLDEIDRTVGDGDVEGFREFAHALRSSAANVGAMNVFDLCLEWRDIGQEELLNDGDRRLKALRDEYAMAREMLVAFASGEMDLDATPQPLLASRRG